ncbi:haloacid dehalogenase [Mammaliicoccus stepanovicii]|uniref:Putative HAD superfamily hydrolase n=2 Tax=Mammaliicoccus stepanovicii TaxID=643214 RepID=A0A239ZEI4_9STAP|nr:Cof-type HAD-IIB family hydrolase [Mammaliicoccus stepanovicii]GGI41980.1 haloacid dehalogenase [Mammaliicoccus stepanovicii]SNV69108.1 putative HAD superfamily hydrolase [Mammaliicoccus stepanovicii]
MAYKYIVMDMDDTLLTSNNEISEKTFSYLMEKQREGMKLILASGRPTAGMIKHAVALEMDKYHGFIVSYNGAYVIDAQKDEIIYKETISKVDAHKIIDFCREHNFFYLTYIDDAIVFDRTHEYMNIESDLTGLPMKSVDDLKDFITGDVPKVMGVDFEENIAKANSALNGQFNEQISSTISKPYFLEFMNHQVSKGKTLEKLFNKINIDFEDVIAFGDSLNDYDMLEKAGVGVAMGNANDTIKNIANIVTEDHDHDGIVVALEKLLTK